MQPPVPPSTPRQPSPVPERSWEHLPDVFGSVEDISDALVTREQHQFLLTDGEGNIPPGSRRGLGLYSRDTRHLSVYELRLDGALPLVLLSRAESGFSQEQVLGNHRKVQDGRIIGRCTIELTRQRLLHRSVEERLTVTNYNAFPVDVDLSYELAADFADIFEIRGHKRSHPGVHSTPEVEPGSICYRYFGADGVWRRTLIEFDCPPDHISTDGARYTMTLGARETTVLHLRIVIGEETGEDADEALRRLRTDYAQWSDSFAHIHTDNETFNKVLDRSLSDLRMLWTHNLHDHSYMAAGTPWFATFFGRDSIIASLQTLPFRPDIARETLAFLARHQGRAVDSWRVEEPGKILHEMREDELSSVRELPYQRYYGSVDSTPLFLLLAAEYYHWTADRELLENLMPALRAALRWLRDYGDQDKDGFIEYITDAPDGLRNQGWKDSVEAIMHEDGTLCEGPIALAEVQAYVYAAYLRLAPVFVEFGDGHIASELRVSAAKLRRKFNRQFWLPRQRRIAMALDGEKGPSTVMSSNAGQVLWGGILGRNRAALVKDALFQNDMFSGWGIRTLSSSVRSYYPLGYHVGTIWPHDNSIIAQGLKRYGFDDEVNELATSLFDAAREFPSYRLPELFGGQSRSEYQPPVPYPVACRPQAWTAGSLLHLMNAILGLYPDATRRRLYVIRPKLPYWLREVHLHGLPIAGSEVDLHFRISRGKTVLDFETRGDIDVIAVRNWRRVSQETGNDNHNGSEMP
jgi:glycogen debranching enzyme